MKINIVGWSGLNHSYSIIAETYMKGFLEIPNVELYFTGYEYFNKDWKKRRETFFDNLPTPSDNDIFDITIRFVYPYNLISDPRSKHTISFMTCEFNYVSDFVDTYDICDNVWVMTPSEYSKKGIIASGIDESKIIVVNHCYDYVESPLTKQQLRDKYKIPRNDYVYYHNSALTSNKNVSAILECFEIIYQENKEVSLLIKGLDNTYGSKNKLIEMLQNIKSKMPFTCESKITYIGNDVTDNDICEYYKLSDCYVSPFLAEGFNLPVLEALCHGIQVICTKGGPPDEFAKDAYFIQSENKASGDSLNLCGNDVPKMYLNPSKVDLLKYMMLIPMVKNTIDKNYYTGKYTYKIICQILYEKIKTILNKTCDEIKIILLDSVNINELIQNIIDFSGNVNICVGIHEGIQYVKPNKNIVCVKIQSRDTCKNLDYVSDLMTKTNTQRAVYICDNVVLFTDPRNICSHECQNRNKYYSYDNNVVIACININNKEYETESVLTMKTYYNCKFKWICKRDKRRILYVFDNIKNKYIKIPMAINNPNSKQSEFYIQPPDTEMTIEKLLRQSDVAVITKKVLSKYQNIFRNAPLTILFDEEEKIIKSGDCSSLNKEKIFVYPESLEYFFNTIYPHINNKFKLYTAKCTFADSQLYVNHDVKKIISECIFV